MTLTPVVRLAMGEDADALAALRYEFRAALGTPTEAEREFMARCTSWMGDRLGRRREWRAWVAERHGELLGTIWLQTIEKIPNPVQEAEVHAYVTNFYVRPAARGSGIGTALLRAALAECRARGVDAVILWPTPRSRSLYLRHGFGLRDDLLELRPATDAAT